MKGIIKILLFGVGIMILFKLLNDEGEIPKLLNEKTNPEPQSPKNLIVRSNGGGVRAKTYDNISQIDITNPTIHKLTAGTIHSYSYEIEGGTCAISIDGNSMNYADGKFGSDTATETFKQEIIFTPGAGCTVRIKTIY